MRRLAPFQPDDLDELGALYALADRVVPMRDISKGDTSPSVIGLRHDVDDNPGSFETALRMAEWEFDHGVSSTYFLLHDSHYWGEEMLCEAPRFEELGHEVGIHVNALAEALRTGREPHRLLAAAIAELRSSGVRVSGCVAHGDALCHEAHFVNDELFTESARSGYGAHDRELAVDGCSVKLEPLSRSVYGLEYDANWLSRGDYLSDSGGSWSVPFHVVRRRFGQHGQLHMLVHPDWWAEAFVAVAA